MLGIFLHHNCLHLFDRYSVAHYDHGIVNAESCHAPFFEKYIESRCKDTALKLLENPV